MKQRSRAHRALQKVYDGLCRSGVERFLDDVQLATVDCPLSDGGVGWAQVVGQGRLWNDDEQHHKHKYGEVDGEEPTQEAEVHQHATAELTYGNEKTPCYLRKSRRSLLWNMSWYKFAKLPEAKHEV